MPRIKPGLFLVLCSLIPIFCEAFIVISSDTYTAKPKECNVGQAYWCKNISTAAECRAVKHCIQAVWEQEVPIEKDTSTVCETCIEMVKEARDQLESNETQSEIRQVLEASCKVIPVRPLRADCDKLMDDFGSYLVDTLASEMNPQVVCSVAGLCNNPAYKQQPIPQAKLTCDSCFGLMKQVEDKIDTASENDIRTALVGICRNFGTYSDACAALVIEHLPQIANLIGQNIKALPVCSLAGVCTQKFHSHAVVELEDDTNVEVISGDDLPCDLCKQLVVHLKDVLIANTTEEEFKLVLQGLCNQMKGNYKTECAHFVDSYYDVVYHFLIDELDGKLLCAQIGICPNSQDTDTIMKPLVPGELALPVSLQSPAVYAIRPEVLDPLTILPTSMLGQPNVKNEKMCAFCEYFLHFVQQELTLPSSEQKIRQVVEQGCSRLPTSVSQECVSFVETYTDAFIALLANRIDPSQVCPGLGLCAGKLIFVEYKDKPTCPLCLLAMEDLLHKISNRTEEDINDALDDLCIRDVFPNSLTTECAGFVTKYRQPLTDMIMAGFTAEEACLYSDLCVLPKPLVPQTLAVSTEPTATIGSNEISDESNDKETGPDVCILCEFVMSKLEKLLKDHKTEEEIKESVYKVCNYMPHTVTAQCKQFIEEYADLIIELLANQITPKEMCTGLNFCGKASALLSKPVRRCLACEMLMESLKAVITDESIDSDFNYKLIVACRRLPFRREVSTCMGIVRQLAPQIEAVIRSLPIGPMVCKRVGICGFPGCSIGPAFWCANEENAAMCQEREFCHSNMEEKLAHSRQTKLKGTHVI